MIVKDKTVAETSPGVSSAAASCRIVDKSAAQQPGASVARALPKKVEVNTAVRMRRAGPLPLNRSGRQGGRSETAVAWSVLLN